MILDVASLTLGILYIPLISSVSFVTGGANATMRRLTWGVRILIAALVVEAVKLVINLAMLPDAKFQIVLSVVCLVLAAATLKSVLRRRQLKGEEVVTEAERILREWHPGGQGWR